MGGERTHAEKVHWALVELRRSLDAEREAKEALARGTRDYLKACAALGELLPRGGYVVFDRTLYQLNRLRGGDWRVDCLGDCYVAIS